MDTNQEKHHDQIGAYLRNELSIEDKALFEQALLDDSELLKEFKIHQELFVQIDESLWVNDFFTPDESEVKKVEAYFKSTASKKLKDTIANVQVDYRKKETSPFLNRKLLIPLLVAASLGLFIVLYNINSTESAQDLYAQYGRWQDLPSLTSRSDDGHLAKAQSLFEEGDYLKANEVFKTFEHSEEKVTPSVLIYIGISALELNNYEEAIFYFDKLIMSNVIDSSKGYWYKTLVYLKQDKKKDAILILETLTEDKSNYNYQVAIKLLKKLR